MLYIFWILSFLIIYTYFLYPLLIYFISTFYKKKTYKKNYNLKVDFLVLAYNEEKVIEKKILNSLKALEKFKNSKLWIVSDGSTDNTNNIIKSFYIIRNKFLTIRKIR